MQCRSAAFHFKCRKVTWILFDAQTLDQKGKRILISQVWKAYMHSLVSMHITYRSHTHIHTYTSTNCTYVHIQHTDRHVCPRTCEHVDAEDGFVRSSTERQQNANARIIYAKFARRRARGERAWQNVKYRMQNANRAVDSIRESEVEIGPTMIEGAGSSNGLGDLGCTADSIDSKSGQAFVISQIVRHIIFRFRLVWTFETPR